MAAAEKAPKLPVAAHRDQILNCISLSLAKHQRILGSLSKDRAPAPSQTTPPDTTAAADPAQSRAAPLAAEDAALPEDKALPPNAGIGWVPAPAGAGSVRQRQGQGGGAANETLRRRLLGGGGPSRGNGGGMASRKRGRGGLGGAGDSDGGEKKKKEEEEEEEDEEERGQGRSAVGRAKRVRRELRGNGIKEIPDVQMGLVGNGERALDGTEQEQGLETDTCLLDEYRIPGPVAVGTDKRAKRKGKKRKGNK
ncbi:hypothetical protein P8C59_006319 [Phyllachora maydis]|uniref:Uncharacterized protein n=1 Tax=Phyllachora maydis TaxID=1825666 RepID=A0AAD9I7C8_9PEZI|nr:hypothetical protein P8C59_006319 [Phyllachora maydis]